VLDNIYIYYIIVFIVSASVALLLTPLMRLIALRFNILDHPSTPVKTHTKATPYLGGIAIWIGFMTALVFVRLTTNFPTGTLHKLHGMLWGALSIIMLGLIDDFHPRGIGFKKKFFFQIISAVILIWFGITINFIQPSYISLLFTILWVVGITNAFNIIDIMDGLSSSVAIIAAIAFLVIALPSEQIYVNVAAAALAGACIGFLPYNLSRRLKIFMGDTGSLFIGFILASLSIGTSYSTTNRIGIFAPLIILGIPIYDTILVSIYRIMRNKSPFLGSKDHFALRLEAMGCTRPQILTITIISGIMLAIIAYVCTQVSFFWALLLYILVSIELIISGFWFYRVNMDE
jgi:UDP-GlcNAc:undecaprenyl-phosphate GlcNAc-1-phosphate transferase